MTPAELRDSAAVLERQAAKLREMADSIDAPRLTLVPDESPARPKTPTVFFRKQIDAFSGQWQKAKGARYVLLPQDKPQFGKVLQQLSQEEAVKLPLMFARYLADREPFVVEAGHPLWLFAQRFSRYRATEGQARAQQQELRPLTAG